MFNKKYFSLLFAIFCALILALHACHRGDHHDEGDLEAPVLTITKPAEGAMVQGSVQILLNTADDVSLQYMTVRVTRDSDNSEVFKQEVNVHHKTSYDFDKSFTPTGLTTETPMTLTVEVEDHAANKTIKAVKFKAKS